MGNQYPETAGCRGLGRFRAHCPASTPTDALPTGRHRMFLFFSNRLGCFGSLVLSLVVTGLLILVFFR